MIDMAMFTEVLDRYERLARTEGAKEVLQQTIREGREENEQLRRDLSQARSSLDARAVQERLKHWLGALDEIPF